MPKYNDCNKSLTRWSFRSAFKSFAPASLADATVPAELCRSDIDVAVLNDEVVTTLGTTDWDGVWMRIGRLCIRR